LQLIDSSITEELISLKKSPQTILRAIALLRALNRSDCEMNIEEARWIREDRQPSKTRWSSSPPSPSPRWGEGSRTSEFFHTLPFSNFQGTTI